MPHSVSRVETHKLHPTIAAEVSGIDFSKPVEAEDFKEIYKAISEVIELAITEASEYSFSRYT